MSKMNRRKFIRVTTLLPIAGAILGTSCDTDTIKDIDKEAVSYNILDTTKTTLSETIAPLDFTRDPLIIGSEIDAMLNAGYGNLKIKAGEAHTLRKEMLNSPVNYTDATTRKSLLMFPQITDVHITDIEGPDRMVYGYITANTSAYRPNAIYGTHVLDAMIQTFSALHSKEKFDFVLATGDLSDNASAIEVMWFNTALNGGIIIADTGEINDPIPGDGNDFTDPYITKGLPEGLEWYVAVGNHDVLHQGISFVTDEVAAHHEGNKVLKGSLMCEDDFYVGSQDASTKYGDPKCAFDKLITKDKETGEDKSAKPYIVLTGKECNTDAHAKASCKDEYIAPDPRRKAFRSHKEWFDNINDADIEHPNLTADKFGYYSVQPNLDIPIEMIFLDFAAIKNDFIKSGKFKPYTINSDGYLDNEQFEWLKNKLNSLRDEKKGAILAFHHPIATMHEDSEISATTLVETLQNYDNILAVISGHTHVNKVQFYKATNELNSFVQIVTCSLLDFPEQARIYEFVYNDNKTLSLFTTMLNHASKEDSFSDTARKISLAQFRAFDSKKRKLGLGKLEDRNTEIIIPIPQYLQEEFEKVTVAKNYIRTLKFDA